MKTKIKAVLLILVAFCTYPCIGQTWTEGYHMINDWESYGEISICNDVRLDIFGGDIYELAAYDNTITKVYDGTIDGIGVSNNSIVDIYGGDLKFLWADGNSVVNLYAYDICFRFLYGQGNQEYIISGKFYRNNKSFSFYMSGFTYLHIHILSDTAKIIYVDAGAMGMGTGESWEDAYTELQSALSSAKGGDEIWVAAGTYTPTYGSWEGQRYRTFQLKNGVSLYGGFAGNETSRDQRDWNVNQTILSGDLLGDDNNNIDYNEPSRQDNCYHVFNHSRNLITYKLLNLEPNAVLDGFTITGGNANGSGFRDRRGGGMLNWKSSPTVINCIFRGNSAEDAGGGADNEYFSNPSIINCSFINNSGTFYGGGGMNNERGNPIVTNCRFIENSTECFGGGIYNDDGDPIITNCVFNRNSAEWGGGGMYNWSGSQIVTDCLFIGNVNKNGGGGGMSNMESDGLIITNCIFAGNISVGYFGSGGGISDLSYNSSTINCTFSGNSALIGGGIYNGRRNQNISNCILWGNIAPYSPQIFNYDSNSIITYNNIEGDWPGVGNIDVDPLFVDANNGDYHLKSEGWRWDSNREVWTWDGVTSACIDAGNPGSPLGDELLTIPVDPENKWGINRRIDMGAYGGTAEASMPPYNWAILADLNNDGTVNFLDFVYFSNYWLTDGEELLSDLDRNNITDSDDLHLFIEDWLKSTSWCEVN
jgi:hypothetical protein